jgi:hypothetical protein
VVAYLTRNKERKILLTNFSLSLDPINTWDGPILQECKNLGLEYRRRFNDNDFDEKYNRLYPKLVNSEIANLSDEPGFISIFRDHKENTNFYRDFFGKYYTVSFREKSLINNSAWDNKRKDIQNLLTKYPRDAKLVISAIHEINRNIGGKYKNYYMVRTEAINKGFSGKNWIKILSELQLIGVIPSGDYKSLYIYEELIPLVEEILEQ